MTKFAYFFNLKAVILIGLAIVTAACATSNKSDPRDPWEGWNRGVQGFNDNLDNYFMKPIATGYQTITPKFVDQGITNFFSNVDDIAVIANDILQFKLKESGMNTGRLLLNTTVGLGGFVDVASHLDLPKQNEDLDQTLGYWGIPSGPYIVMPLIGPSTPRGVVGLAGDTMSNPIIWITPVGIPYGAGTLKTVDMRADRLTASKIVDEASVDRYEFIRNAYFQDRDYKIHDGNPPPDEDDLLLEKEMDALEHLDGNKQPSTPK